MEGLIAVSHWGDVKAKHGKLSLQERKYMQKYRFRKVRIQKSILNVCFTEIFGSDSEIV